MQVEAHYCMNSLPRLGMLFKLIYHTCLVIDNALNVDICGKLIFAFEMVVNASITGLRTNTSFSFLSI